MDRRNFLAAAPAAIPALILPEKRVEGIEQQLQDKLDYATRHIQMLERAQGHREYHAHQQRLKNLDEAHLCLMQFGFDVREVSQVYKDIAKKNHIKTNVHATKFSNNYYGIIYGRLEKPAGFPYTDLISSVTLWQAILVTYRTGQDGFWALDIEKWWKNAHRHSDSDPS